MLEDNNQLNFILALIALEQIKEEQYGKEGYDYWN